MPLRHGRRQPDQRIELVVTVSVGLVWSGQHLEHNAQRHEAPTHSTSYFVITIEGKKSTKERKSSKPKTLIDIG